MRKQKTERGDRVTDPREIVPRLLAGHWFYVGDKPVNAAILINLPISRVVTLVRCGRLYECLSAETGLAYTGQDSKRLADDAHTPLTQEAVI